MTPVLLFAPLHGVTGRAFRSAYFRRFPGFDAVYAPFIIATGSARPGEKQFKDMLPDPEASVPLVPQILGNDAAAFIATGKVLADFGYGEINWNLGCPYPMVADKKRGSGLLPHPDLIDRFLSEVCPRLPVPVSVKVRLGRTDPRELLTLAPVLNAFPLSSVIIHPRVGVQMYSGVVDLEGFAAAAALLRHPVAFNGDIRDAETFRALRDRFPFVSAWMIGRGAIADPFLQARIKGLPLPSDPVSAVRAFHDDVYREYRELLSGSKHVLDKMTELWTFLCPRHAEERAVKDILRAKTLEKYEAAAASFFESPCARTRIRYTGS